MFKLLIIGFWVVVIILIFAVIYLKDEIEKLKNKGGIIRHNLPLIAPLNIEGLFQFRESIFHIPENLLQIFERYKKELFDLNKIIKDLVDKLGYEFKYIPEEKGKWILVKKVKKP